MIFNIVIKNSHFLCYPKISVLKHDYFRKSFLNKGANSDVYALF